MMRVVLRGTALISLLSVGSCSELQRESGYFEKRVNEVTIEMVAKRYGAPHQAERLDGGRMRWTYFERGSGTSGYAGTARSTGCRAYQLTFDKEEILREWNPLECRN